MAADFSMTKLRAIGKVARRLAGDFRVSIESLSEVHRDPSDYPIETSAGATTPVEAYWTHHTVNSVPFRSAASSLRYLAWRSEQYPLFHTLMELWGDHRGHVVLDYGCGPGNDLVGFLVHARARSVIGIDVSASALHLARRRIGLHNIDPDRIRLMKASDASPIIALDEGSVDFVYCEGVLHHATNPAEIMSELRRVLRADGRALVMGYNHDSLWLHLYVAYQRQILKAIDSDLTTDEAFARSTDGEDCPIARPYRPAEFEALAESVGFNVTYRGGYFSQLELELWESLGRAALVDPRLPEVNRRFLQTLQRDPTGYPTIEGLHAGVGGVYELRK